MPAKRRYFLFPTGCPVAATVPRANRRLSADDKRSERRPLVAACTSRQAEGTA